MTKFRKKGPLSQINGPLPHLKDEARKADETDALEPDRKHRNFSARDMLKRIVQHKPGEPVSLRSEDEHFHEILEDSGLVDLSRTDEGTTATRTEAQDPAKPIETLTFRMEQIHENRKKLLGQISTKTTD